MKKTILILTLFASFICLIATTEKIDANPLTAGLLTLYIGEVVVFAISAFWLIHIEKPKEDYYES